MITSVPTTVTDSSRRVFYARQTPSATTDSFAYKVNDGNSDSSSTTVTLNLSVVSSDFGDAPTAAQSGFTSSYPTALANSGAWHAATGVTLGSARDSESDGQPTAGADGDDTNGSDDEDGVTGFTTMYPGSSSSVTVNASASAYLNAWIDFNRDGDWDDSGEQIASGNPLSAGNNTVSFSVPSGATTGTTYARFRLSSTSSLTPTGGATDGEVEDYSVSISASLNSNVVSWWKAENNAYDAVGRNDGAFQGTPAYAAGRVGNAFSFNGNTANYVQIPNSASLQTANLTVEYWVYFNSAHNPVIVNKRSLGGGDDAWQFGITYDGANYQLQFCGWDGSTMQCYYSANLSSPVGVWTHIAGTYDGATIRGYVNGTEVLTQTASLSMGTQSADIFLGKHPSGANPFDGLVDELTIYNTALSQFEIQSIYNAGSTGKALEMDFGDAPTAAQSGFTGTYPTYFSANGARHRNTGLYLGFVRDAETDGDPTAAADGDDETPGSAYDDDDGVHLNAMNIGQSAKAFVKVVNGPGKLDAWIDFNRDGDWDDTGEQIASSADVSTGSNTITFSVPNDALPGRTYARFRLSTAGGLAVTGAATDGEVEDYVVLVAPTISSLSAYSGTPGATSININGTGFDADTADNTVFFGATKATVTAATTTQLTVTVPDGATFGLVTVTVNGASAYSAREFLPTFSGSGSATFGSRVDFATPGGGSGGTPPDDPRSAAIGDLDGDGKPEVVVCNGGMTNVSVYLNAVATPGDTITTSSFSTRVDVTAGEFPRSVALGDIDKDGKLDIVVANGGSSSSSISVIKNNSTVGNLSFATKVDFAAVQPNWVSVVDVDRDGRPDILAANVGVGLSVYRNIGVPGVIDSGTFYFSRLDLATQQTPQVVSAGDFDGDGWLDLIALDYGVQNVAVFHNTVSTGTLSNQGAFNSDCFGSRQDFAVGVTVASPPPPSDVPQGMVLADFNADGKLDVAVTIDNPSGGLTSANFESVTLLRSTSTGSGNINFDSLVRVHTGGAMRDATVGDLDGDGKPDVAAHDDVGFLGQSLRVVDNTSSGATLSFVPGALSQGKFVSGIAAGDLNGDDKPELVFGNYSDGKMSVVQNTTGTTAAPEIHVTGNSVVISDGAATASSTNHTDFGTALANSGSVARTFTIHNSGSGALTLTGSPKVVLSGADASHFSVTTQPSSPVGSLTIVNSGFETPDIGAWAYQSTSGNPNTYNFNAESGFGWTFGTACGLDSNSGTWYTPSAPEGGQAAFIQNTGSEAVISQSINFPATGTYTISFSCVGRNPQGPNDIEVRMDGATIATIGNASQSQSAWQTFTATYNCTATGNHTLAFAGTRTGGDYSSVIDDVEVTLSSTTFTITYAPTASGTHTATVSIDNNDSDEATYDFAVQGTGSASVTQNWSADNGGGNGSGNGTADTLRVRLNGSNIEFSADNFITVSSVPAANVSSLTINGSSDDDTFVIDFSNGNPIPSGGITITGGSHVTTGDSLQFVGGSHTTVTYTFVNNNDGSVTFTGEGTVSYTGLEPITDNGSASARVFDFTGGAETITLTDTGGADGMMTIDSTLGESVNFSNPTSSLTINAGTGADTVTISTVDSAFTAALTINGNDDNDTINLNADITFASGNSLDVDLTNDSFSTAIGDDVISIGSNANLLLSGTGAATLKCSKNIALASGSSVVTANGNLTLEANSAGTTAGSFIGVDVDGGLVQATGTGAVSVTGKGGDDAGGSQMGVRVQASGSIIGGSGNVTVSGTGRGSGSGIQNIGVLVRTAGAISATSTGALAITGSGGSATGDQNHGVAILAAVSANNGDVTINGTGGGSGTSGINRGIQIGGSTEAASVTAAGANTVSLTGTGGSGSGGNNQGVMVLTSAGQTTAVTTAGGTMTFTGTPGGSTTHGIDISGGGTSTSIATGGGDLTLIADGMSLSSTALSLSAGAGSATLRQLNNGTAITLGAADSAGTLGLTDAELDYITATTVNIGDSNSGSITVSADITHANGNAFVLNSNGSNINLNAGFTTAGGAVTFSDPVRLGANASVDTTNGGGTAAGADITFTATATVNADAAGNNRTLTLAAGTGGAITMRNVGATANLQTFTISSGASASLQQVQTRSGGISVTATAITLNANLTTDALATAGNVSLTGAITLAATPLTIDTDAGTTDGNITFGTLADNGNGSFRVLNLTAGSGSVTFTTSPGALNFEVDGTVAGTSHDRINVTGTINLNNTALTIPNSTISSSPGQQLRLIDNDGTDLVTGTFNGLADGAAVTINSLTFYVSYNGGDGNDVTLTQDLAGSPATYTAGGGNDTLQLRRVGSTIQILDAGSVAASYPIGSVGAGFTINGGAGDDTLTLNYTDDATTDGFFALPITFNGGAQTTSDTLVLTDPPGNFTTVTHTFTTANDGSINMDGTVVSYTGLEPVTDNLSATDRVFTFTGGAETVSLTDAVGANMTIDSTLGESVTFANPTASLTINAGTGNDTINITSMDAAYAGSLTINGDAGTDTVTLSAGLPTLSALTIDTDLLNALPALTVTGNVSINVTDAAGSITQTGAMTVGGTASFTTVANPITLTQANDFQGAVSLTNTGGNNVSITDANAITLGTVSIGNNLTISAAGLVDFAGGAAGTVGNNLVITTTAGGIDDSGTGSLAITGATTLTAGAANNITLDNGNNFGGNVQIVSGNNVALNDTGAFQFGGGVSTISGTLALTTAGAITDASNISVAGTATLSSGAANSITLNNNNNFNTVVVTSALNVNLNDTGAINLGNLTVSGSLTVTAAGLIDFTGAGASTVGTTMSLTTTAGGITDSGTGSLAVTGASTLVAGAANNITLNNNNDFTTVAITSGNNVTINDTAGNLTFNASTVSGTLAANVTAVNGVLTISGAVTYQGTVTFVADNMAINANVDGGAGADTVNLRQSTAGTLIGLGAADAAGTLGLTDAELDRFIGGGTETINIGDASSGAVTISAAIARATTANITITTAGGNNIAFSGAASLDATTTGDVTLTTSGTGAITSGTAGTDITGDDISLNAGSGGIGAGGNPIVTDSATIAAATGGNADAHLSDAGTTILQTINVGTGTAFLTSGTFQVAAAGATALTGKLDISGTLSQVAAGRFITGGDASDTVRVRSGGSLDIFGTGAAPYSDLFNATVATGRTPPTLDSGSTINWQSGAATTVDLTTFENVNFNGAGPFALSGDTTVTTGGNTMTVSSGSTLNTSGFNVIGAGNFTLASNATLGITSAAGITTGATGNIQVTGTRSFSASGDYVYNGSAAQVTGNALPTAITSPGSLTINNGSGVTLSQDTTTILLNLTAGRFYTFNGGANGNLTVQSLDGRTSGFVVGRYTRQFTSAGGGQSHTFHLGDDNGNYTPFAIASLTVNTVNSTITALVKPDYNGASAAVHPNITAGGQPIAGLDSTKSLLRYWSLSATGSFGTYSPTITYIDPADVQGNEARYMLRRYNNDGLGLQWHLTSNNTRDTVNNQVSATGVSNFGDFTAGEQTISFYSVAHPNTTGELLNSTFQFTVTPRDYLGGAVLSGHESVTLTYNAYLANTTTASSNFRFDTPPADPPATLSPFTGAAFTTGSQMVNARGSARETLDIVVTDGSGRNGVLEDLIIGNAPTAVIGGSAVQMTGTGYGITDDLSDEFTDESVTVELWFKIDTSGTGGVIFDERGAANAQGFRDSWIEAVGSAGGPYDIRIRVWNLPAHPTTGVSLGSVSDGNWHHVALRYDKSIFRLEGFLDGVKSANFATGDRTTPLEDTIARDGIFFGIGLANTTHLGNGAAFKGSIDEVRIWSVARTDAQIQANWQQTVDPDSAGLVAYYQFEDGSGTVASDSTSNGLDLTFINFTPTWVSADWFNGGAATVSVAVGATVTVTLDGQDPEDTGTLTARITAFSNGPRVTLQDDGNAAVISGAAPNYTLSTAAQRRLRITGNATGSETVTYVVNNGIADSASVTLTINVTGSANAPVINTTTGTFGPVNEDTSPVNITHANLIALLAVTDADTAAASLVFRVRGVSNGVLKKGGAEITPFVTTINNTESLDWHPPANNNGALSAFTVDVYDGAQYSTAIGTVQVNLTAQNDTPVTQELAAPAVPANTALFLDGVDDYLVTPDLSGYITNESVTLEIWFKPTTAAGVLNHGVIVSERGSSSLAGWRSTSIELLASGQVKARVWNLSAINLGSVLTNEWNHAVLIYNATTQRLSGYLNGVSSTTLSGGTATGDRRTPVEDGYPGIFYDVGASNPQNLGSGAFFKGYVAEFRVWSKARSAQSIVGSHLGQSLANEAGLVAWYKLDEAAGTIAATTADASGNARHATLSNSTSTMFVDADTLITASGSYVIPLEAMDPDGDSLTWVLKTPPTNGKIYHHLGGGVKGAQITALTTLGINPGTGTLADPDSVVYEPVAGTYTDTLVFYVQDANGVDSTDGTVTIDVAGVTRQAAGFAQSGSSGTATAGASHASSAGAGSGSPGGGGGGAGGSIGFTLGSLVQILTPWDGSTGSTEQPLTVSVLVSDLLGPAARVEVYADGLPLGEAAFAGGGVYVLELRGLPAGGYTLRAVACDSAGTMVISPPVGTTLFDPIE